MTSVAAPPTATAPAEHLSAAWRRAANGDPAAQASWQTVEGGGWGWATGGACLSGGGEWAALAWRACGAERLRALGSFVIEITVRGRAHMAGLSLGPYKDFLIELADDAAHRLRLEVDGNADRWQFSVDGTLQTRNWWDSHITHTGDLLDAELCLKAYAAERVVFSDFTIHTPTTACQLSIILTCNRFLQRLRVTLRTWCEQSLEASSYEVLVVNPAGDDGCHAHMAAVSRSYPHLRVREIAVEPALALNKGAMINQAVAASRGRWVWLTDADCLFSYDSAAQVLQFLQGKRPALYYGERHHLSEAQTDALLAGRLDGLRDFHTLFQHTQPNWVDRAPWGYTQIVPRATLERTPYGVNINHFAHTDNIFAEQCQRRGLIPTLVPGLRCLHLVHPFAWYGTSAFL